MSQSRRSFLKIGSLTALALGSGGLAGCVDSFGGGDGEDGDGESAQRRWLFDPSAHVDVDNELFGSVDVARLFESDQLPDEMVEEIEREDENVDSVDLLDLRRASGVGYAAESGETGGAVVVEGSFDPDAVGEELREEDDEVEEYDEYGGFRLFGVEEETYDGSARSIAFGVSEEVAVVGYAERSEFGARQAVEASIDAEAGDADRYYDESANAATVFDELDDATALVGADFDQTITDEMAANADERVAAVVDSMDAVGYGVTLDGDVATHSLVLVYDSADAASAENVRTLLDTLEEEGFELIQRLDDVGVSADGRAVVVSAEGDAETIWSEFNPYGAIGSDQHSETVSATPQVQLSFEFEAEGEVAIQHLGGDALDSATVIYESGGETREEEWSEEDGIMAGDMYTLSEPVDGGTVVRVLWSQDGQEVVLAEATAP